MREFLRRYPSARGAFVKVGVTADVGGEPKKQGTDKPASGKKPLTLVEVAWFNEFGTKHIPERSFIRSTTDEQRSQLAQIKKRLAIEITAGRQTVASALAILGEWMQAQIQQKITRLSEPPNAPSTVARKGSRNPLIDTGQLRQSIRYQVTVPNPGGGR